MNRKYRILVISVGMLLGTVAAIQAVAYYHEANYCVGPETADDPYCDAKDLLWHGEVYDDERAESVAVETPVNYVGSVDADEPEPIEVSREEPPPPPNVTEVSILNEEKSEDHIDLIRVSVLNSGGPERGRVVIRGHGKVETKLHEGETIAFVKGSGARNRDYTARVYIDGEVVGRDSKSVR